jgi:hypothetical protein
VSCELFLFHGFIWRDSQAPALSASALKCGILQQSLCSPCINVGGGVGWILSPVREIRVEGRSLDRRASPAAQGEKLRFRL